MMIEQIIGIGYLWSGLPSYNTGDPARRKHSQKTAYLKRSVRVVLKQAAKVANSVLTGFLMQGSYLKMLSNC